jgi:hypothetical protein
MEHVKVIREQWDGVKVLIAKVVLVHGDVQRLGNGTSGVWIVDHRHGVLERTALFGYSLSFLSSSSIGEVEPLVRVWKSLHTQRDAVSLPQMLHDLLTEQFRYLGSTLGSSCLRP